MNKVNYWQDFYKLKNQYCIKYKERYKAEMKDARNKKQVHGDFSFLKAVIRRNEIRSEIHQSKNNDFWKKVKWVYDRNNSKKLDKIFNDRFKDIIGDKQYWLALLAEAKGLDKFYIFYNKEGKKFTPVKTISEIPAPLKSPIQWIGKKNKTEFIQLIYALHEIKYLTNTNDEITNLVLQVAQAFNLDMGKNPNSNLTHNIKNYGTKSEIFDKLKRTYIKYAQKIIDKSEEN